MTAQHRWQDPDWLKLVHQWIDAETARLGVQVTGGIEQPHVQHWSTVLRIPTNEGTLFFKATAPETKYEIALTCKLAEWSPADLPQIIAADIDRGWMLMRDGGEALRASIRPARDVSPWEPVIVHYAQLQMRLAEHAGEMLLVGIPDHRLHRLPSLLDELLNDLPPLMINEEKGLSAADYARAQNLAADFEKTCTKLAALGIPETINHGDFHDGNILLKDGRITFFDWGDADITHPFVSLRTFFVSMEIALNLEDFAPPTDEMLYLLQSYLKEWGRFQSGDQIKMAYQLSRPVASVVKALAWRQSITQMDDTLRPDYAWIVPELVREFIHNATAAS